MKQQQEPTAATSWVRGVNLGSWLVLERYIVPYQFALTDCHLQGNFCWYPGALSAPPNATTCDLTQCKPSLTLNRFGKEDYPLDERGLAEAFLNAHPANSTRAKEIATDWLNVHFEHFITKDDLIKVKEAGATHVRVPLPHWIMGDVRDDEPWIVGDRWKYFVRLCKWARELDIQVWPDIHTAPGSQNGFDNSGQAKSKNSCLYWASNPQHVERSLTAIREITGAIAKEGLQDVVTGFGLLNEPFTDCDYFEYRQFINDGLNVVRTTLGENTAVYVSDMFKASDFNDGEWWLNQTNTYLDSHYYQVFGGTLFRGLSPRQHIAYACQKQHTLVNSCCYGENNSPSTGVQRMVGEWSSAFDILPDVLVNVVMAGIAENGTAPHFDRTLSPERQEFIRNFNQAQMVTFESTPEKGGGAWFYWSLKMEGGAFAEWDFLRGVEEGWMPLIPSPNMTSESVYGSCYDIMFRTDDSMDVIEQFPDPSTIPEETKVGFTIDDDVVLSHGESLYHGGDGNVHVVDNHGTRRAHFALFGMVLVFMAVVWRVTCSKNKCCRKKAQYSVIDEVCV